MEACERCGGTGFEPGATRTDKQNRTYETRKPCGCRRPDRVQTEDEVLRALRIPTRYHHCTIMGFEPNGDRVLDAAYKQVMQYCFAYPSLGSTTKGLGLLFTGTNGVGKTHLAVATLRELAAAHGVRGQFWDFHELLREIKSSYDHQKSLTEYEVLEPVIQTEVLLLDDLGAWKMTDWMNDTLFHVLNQRYLACRPTLITTNYPEGGREEQPEKWTPEAGVPPREHFVDRVGQRLRSRLLEACAIVQLGGGDRRVKQQHKNREMLR